VHAAFISVRLNFLRQKQNKQPHLCDCAHVYIYIYMFIGAHFKSNLTRVGVLISSQYLNFVIVIQVFLLFTRSLQSRLLSEKLCLNFNFGA
jgi:hypothetical protein